jgi:phospholipase/carboxylesterase
MSHPDLGFTHRFVPGPSPTLLLLHGTGGDETDLLPLGRALDPTAALLSPRGQVLEHGMPRFFRRLAEGVFDQEDLVRRTHELAAFVRDATAAYGLDASNVVAVGFSNGANIAASVLLLHPGLLRGAVLLSPMVPFEPEHAPDLSGTSVFIGAGRTDPIAPPERAEQLATILRLGRADVTMHVHPGGHTLTTGEVDAAREWLARLERRVGVRAAE